MTLCQSDEALQQSDGGPGCVPGVRLPLKLVVVRQHPVMMM